jgi:hypothetical protein
MSIQNYDKQRLKNPIFISLIPFLLFQQEIDTINVSRSQLQQHIIEVENERMVKIIFFLLHNFIFNPSGFLTKN